MGIGFWFQSEIEIPGRSGEEPRVHRRKRRRATRTRRESFGLIRRSDGGGGDVAGAIPFRTTKDRQI